MSTTAIHRSLATMTAGPITPLLARLTAPMVLAVLSTIGYSVAETWFIGRVGAEALAAVSFTFPVTMVVISLAIGLGAGTSAIVARALGRGEEDVAGLVTDSLLLTAGCGAVAAIGCVAVIAPLFRALGTPDALVPTIAAYLHIWLPAVLLFMTGMVGLSAARAAGDARFQGLAMAGAAGLNLVLGPCAIFGVLGLPGMGLRGAAVANAMTWTPFFLAALWRLRTLGLLGGVATGPARFLVNARRILRVGVPAAAANTIIPVSSGIVTGILAGFGEKAVAGFGVATRVEALAMVVFFALSAVMNPFAGQNGGAGRLDRVREAINATTVFCGLFGLAVAAALYLGAPAIADQFTRDPEVTRSAVSYLRLVPISYGAAGMIAVVNAGFNGLNRPLSSVAVSVARMFVVNVPVAYAGGRLFGVPGVFAGICIANLLVGWLSVVWIRRATAETAG